MQANGSLPVIPLYLPVPPVMIWVPTIHFRLRLVDVRENLVTVAVGQYARAVNVFLVARRKTVDADGIVLAEDFEVAERPPTEAAYGAASDFFASCGCPPTLPPRSSMPFL
jgi:hypothetical protein